MLCCDTCVNDSDGVTAFGVRHNQKPARRGHSESDHPFFTCGVIGIGARHRQRVVERAGGFCKCYPVLAEVLSSLGGVPFEMHVPILSTVSYLGLTRYKVRSRLRRGAQNRADFHGGLSLAVIGETAYARVSRGGKPRTFF